MEKGGEGRDLDLRADYVQLQVERFLAFILEAMNVPDRSLRLGIFLINDSKDLTK